MASFKKFMDDEDFIQSVQNLFEFDSDPEYESDLDGGEVMSAKPWSAKKSEILNMWRGVKPNLPIFITPLKKDRPVGSKTYGEDGIRVTGTYNFIMSVLSRLKDLMNRENPETRLKLVLRSVSGGKQALSDQQSYAFYINLERRSKRKSGRPKKIELGPLKPI
jgi:hypothetical protein